MRVDDFDFDLPRDLIAERPAEPRGSARMLRVSGDGMADLRVADLARLLKPGDVMVFNDTRVIPARLVGKRGLAGIEVTLHQRLGPDSWKVFARPAKKLRPGDRI
ncbi:MAG: tRNA preQ1(34) S-adenosylmethionine ribosyltransferase-isomerase QueA, partial [Magnetospirillum sp.]